MYKTKSFRDQYQFSGDVGLECAWLLWRCQCMSVLALRMMCRYYITDLPLIYKHTSLSSIYLSIHRALLPPLCTFSHRRMYVHLYLLPTHPRNPPAKPTTPLPHTSKAPNIPFWQSNRHARGVCMSSAGSAGAHTWFTVQCGECKLPRIWGVARYITPLTGGGVVWTVLSAKGFRL